MIKGSGRIVDASRTTDLGEIDTGILKPFKD